jgi:glucose/arabinose dehydrogenase
VDAGDLAVGCAVLRRLSLSWPGSLLLGGLSSTALIRLPLDGSRVSGEERIDMQRRIRDVIQARDGAPLVIADDKNGELLRLTPPSPVSQ